MIEAGNGMALVTGRDMLVTEPVMPGQKREARLRADVPGIHVFLSFKRQDVDGWNKSGHDDRER
jgi:hypothetical protein